MAQMRFLVGLDQLSLGSQAKSDLLDSTGSVAVPMGTTISPDILNGLKSRQVKGLFTEHAEFLQTAVPPPVTGIESIAPVVQELQQRAGIEPLVSDTAYREVTALTRETLSRARMGLPIDYGAIDDLLRHIHSEMRMRTSRVFKHPAMGYDGEYLLSHSVNTMFTVFAMTSNLTLSDDEVRKLAMGALLHDIGKVKIDAAILQKPAVLSDEEFDMVRRHPTLGLKVVMHGLDIGDEACRLILHHHERYDGCGYPMKLGRDNISLGGRIMAIADAYDAMTSERVYANKLTPHQALQQIVACSGSQFDPTYAHEFLSMTGAYPDGSVVELNTGEVGVVTNQTPGNIISPKVEIFFGQSLRALPKPHPIDLAADSARYIKGEIQENLH